MLKILDLFCCQGGAGMGYRRAGFDVTGVDMNPQPRYLFQFVQGDALEYLTAHGHEFDAIHASPPCQAHTALKTMPGYRNHPDLIAPTRAALQKIGKPWVLENVPGAPLENPVTLCGTMFGLGVGAFELRRHRHFETSFPVRLLPPCCQHRKRAIGVYGNPGGDSTQYGYKGTVAEWQQAMEIDWMTGAGLAQAVPPAYTEWIGRQLLSLMQQQLAS